MPAYAYRESSPSMDEEYPVPALSPIERGWAGRPGYGTAGATGGAAPEDDLAAPSDSYGLEDFSWGEPLVKPGPVRTSRIDQAGYDSFAARFETVDAHSSGDAPNAVTREELERLYSHYRDIETGT